MTLAATIPTPPITLGSTSLPFGQTTTSVAGMSSISTSAATVGGEADANTLHLTPSANSTGVLLAGGSHTGSDATSDLSFATTLNTSGSPDVFKLAATVTAAGASTKLFNLYGGSSGNTSKFSIDTAGNVTAVGTINKLAITAPATGSTLTISDGKILTVSNTLSFAGTDGSTLNVGSGGTLGSNAFTSIAYAPLASPTFTGTVTFPDSSTASSTGFTGPSNLFSLRNSTNAQSLRVYNTFTNSSNGEWGLFDWQGTTNVLTIGTANNGTGSARNFQFVIGGVSKADYGISHSGQWTFGQTFVNGVLTLATGANIQWNNRAQIASTATNNIQLSNNAGNGSPLVQLGGTTSGFAAFKGSGTTFAVRLGDDSADAPISASSATFSGAATINTTPTNGDAVGLTVHNNSQVSSATETSIRLLVDTAEKVHITAARDGGNTYGELIIQTQSNGSLGNALVLDFYRHILSPEITFASRNPSPTTGSLANFSDSNTVTWGATVAGGGSNHVLARYNGTNWTVVGT